MKIGNFFKVDNSSRFDDGIIYFRYLRIHRRRSKGSESDYPIYLHISSSAIIFYLQQRKESDVSEVYNHSELFQIPLSVNFRARENLGNILKDIYDAGIDQFKGNTTDGEKWIYNKYDSKDTYSDPDLIDSKDDLRSTKFLLTFREIILDFLFDLEHSKIFQNSPHHKEMEESLTSYPFFEALSAKYDFYYKRNYFKEYLDKALKCNEKGALTKNEKIVLTKLYKDYYSAHNQWLNVICGQGMGAVICKKNKWFDDIEEEHREVLFDKKIAYNKLRKLNIEINGRETKIVKSNDIRDKLIDSGNWFIRRYDLPNVVQIVLFKNRFTTWMTVVFLGLFFYSILCHIFDYSKFTFKPDNDFWVLNLFIIPFSVIATLIVIPFISWLRGGISTISLLVPRTLMAVFTAWFAIALVTENWLIGFDLRLGSSKTLLTITLLSLIIFIFMLSEVKKITQKKLYSLLPRVLFIFIIALSYSLVAGTISSSYVAKDIMLRTNIAGDFWHEEKGRRFENLAPSIEKLENNPLDSSFNYHFRSLSNVKTHRMNDVEADLMILYKYSFFGKFDLYIFPGMLVISAFIAMFVGVFLQLIFEEKPITEPL